jgi:hypothetical protein
MRLSTEVTGALQPWFPWLQPDRVRIVSGGPVGWFVGSVLRKRAMTFSPFIFFRYGAYDGSSLSSVALLAHELKHIEQYRRDGHPRFLVRYFWDLTCSRFRYSRDLPLEAEAYAIQAEVESRLRERLI